MAIVNRSLDPSEQQHVLQSSHAAVATGATLQVALVPYPATLNKVRVAAFGTSGSPVYALRILRFIAGAGVTSINPGTTNLTITNVGTSGVQSVLLASAGSTLVNLMAGDVLTVTSSGANTAVEGITVTSVIQATQDIKTFFGS